MIFALLDKTIWCLKLFALPVVFLLTLVAMFPLWICGDLEILDGLFRTLASLKKDVYGDDDSADEPS
ncbi:MAG: hypothetical protein JWN70_3776 [Planctomycetaceae bacterium]|nr:hypothetical protein [Planctomycetaceae bacterium]